MPWFPQIACDRVHILCSEGQEPSDSRDHERIPDSEVCGKTLDQLYDICDRQDAAFVAECNAYKAAGMDWRSYNACLSRATSRLGSCRKTARKLTDNGKHPAEC